MPRYFISLVFIILIFGSGIQGCTERIEIRTKASAPVLVIYGCLTDTLGFYTINISKSSPYFADTPNEGIPDAEVSIVSSAGDHYYLEETDKTGEYRTINSICAKPGLTYTLCVKVDFDEDGILEEYSAVSVMPEIHTELDSIRVKLLDPASVLNRKYYSVNLYAYDPPGKDYYMGKFLVNDSLVDDRISRITLLDDMGFDGNYINGRSIGIFPDEEERHRYDDDDDRVFVNPGDKIEFQISPVEKGYYDFISQCQRVMNGENPFFGGPPSNVTTNLTNGAIGYFATYPILSATDYIEHLVSNDD